MIKKFISVLLVTSAISFLTSCATIVHGSHQSIGISSVPSNAHIWVDQNYMGITPMIVAMSRNENHFVHIELDGYQPYDAVFSKQLSGWMLGNIIFGGAIGIAVDAVTGAMYKLTPEQVHVNMISQGTMYSKNTDDSQIFIVLQPDPSWEKIGNLVAAK